jgi:hypothetical protein
MTENDLLSFIKIQSDTIMALNDLLKMLTMPKITQKPQWEEWHELTDQEIDIGLQYSNHALQNASIWRDAVEWTIKQLKEKNT